jgi:hypothetical protein
MEITMATMGRLIKNFDMGLPSLSYRGKWLGVHLHAGTHFLYALSNNAFTSLQSVRNNPLVANAVPDGDCSNAHFVLAIHHCHLIAAL